VQSFKNQFHDGAILILILFVTLKINGLPFGITLD
jgi:hypothetical protein